MRHVWIASLLLGATAVRAIGQTACVSFESSSSAFDVVHNGDAAPIWISEDEWPGVQRAALDFAADIERVTGVAPDLSNVTSSNASTSSLPIIVGTLGRSSLVDDVVNASSVDVSAIEGRWETYLSTVVSNPLPGVDSAYLIVGSDKRGTIFALYDHSEQFGVSPWYWWADVPVTTHSGLYVTSPGCSAGPPTVQYRGIFLNDEQPALQNWAAEKFTNGTGASLTGSPFNHLFYSKLFELILRMRANYLWPAMWSSAFAVDDSENQPLADYFGIAMGTSHEEPMARSVPIEWDLFGTGAWDYHNNRQAVYNFFLGGAERAKPYETVFTVGMRGAGDLPLPEDSSIGDLEQAITDQRQILTQVFNGTDITTIPQVWTLYSEVEQYYADGLKVPDDVTLLWADDNWGNIRRFPVESERNRSGGAGVYYHVDYVGVVRDYKWITSTQIPKAYEQLSTAVDRNATRIWILNVGDLKPYERETEFFLTLAWNASLWNPDNLDTFVSEWAQREFDLSGKDADTVVDIVANLSMFNSRKKPELLNTTTYNLVTYREADRVLAAWDELKNASTKIYDSLPDEAKAAFFQLIHHPVLASTNLGHMLAAAGLNNLRASQAMLRANDLADEVEGFFDTDFDLETEYHTLLDGKWDHMMDQTHVGYAYWQQPMTNSMPAITKVQAKKQALPGPLRIAPEGSLAAWPGDNQFQCANGYGCANPTMTLESTDVFGNVYIDVGAGGPAPFTFSATSNVSWLTIEPSKGSISPDTPEMRVFASVNNWDAVGGSNAAAQIVFKSTTKAQPGQPGEPTMSVPVTLVVRNTRASLPDNFTGFVESQGVVSIEAAHATRNTSVSNITWTEIPHLGRTVSGITPWPRTGADGGNFTAGQGPSVEYDFFTFTNTSNVTLTTLVSPSWNANGLDRPLGFAVQVDDLPSQSSYFIPITPPGKNPAGWNDFVADSIVNVTMTFSPVSAGAHTLKLFMIEPAVAVQKFIINTAKPKYSFLGPPESVHV